MERETKLNFFKIDKKILLIVFIVIAFFVTYIAYFIPLFKYPNQPANPWPEAYEVIQERIIAEQKVPPSATPQFGQMEKIDMTYFLNHHLLMVSLQLLDGLSPELNERFLSFVFTFLIFVSSALFFFKFLPPISGFTASILFLFVPRLTNYYVNTNGEFFSFLLLFLGLYLLIDWYETKDWKTLFLSAIVVGILPILCLITFGVFFLFLFSKFITNALIEKKFFKFFLLFVRLSLFYIFVSVILSVIPLILTGDIKSGASSSIGSLYSKRSANEIVFEKKYYEEFAVYGNSFIGFKPLIRDIYFITLDGATINFFIVFYLLTAMIGIVVVIKKPKNFENSFPIIFAAVMLLFEIFLYSKFFNTNIYNSAERFLLYFSLPIILASVSGITWFFGKSRFPYLIFFSAIILAGIPIFKYGAYSANSYNALYSPNFKQAINWLKDNTPSDAIIASNDWSNGQFWLGAGKYNITEGGKASATYMTYENIYGKLQGSREIFSLQTSCQQSREIIAKYNLSYLVIWTRPTAYYVYPYFQSKEKMEDCGFEKVFDEHETILDERSGGKFNADVIIYKAN